MDDTELKARTRLMAIEYMIANLYTCFYRMTALDDQAIARLHQQARDQLLNTPLTGLDPAQSDLLSAELELAIGRLLNSIEEMMGMRRNPLA